MGVEASGGKASRTEEPLPTPGANSNYRFLNSFTNAPTFTVGYAYKTFTTDVSATLQRELHLFKRKGIAYAYRRGCSNAVPLGPWDLRAYECVTIGAWDELVNMVVHGSSNGVDAFLVVAGVVASLSIYIVKNPPRTFLRGVAGDEAAFLSSFLENRLDVGANPDRVPASQSKIINITSDALPDYELDIDAGTHGFDFSIEDGAEARHDSTDLQSLIDRVLSDSNDRRRNLVPFSLSEAMLYDAVATGMPCPTCPEIGPVEDSKGVLWVCRRSVGKQWACLQARAPDDLMSGTARLARYWASYFSECSGCWAWRVCRKCCPATGRAPDPDSPVCALRQELCEAALSSLAARIPLGVRIDP